MRTWQRAVIETRCGNCRAMIAPGEPCLRIELVQVHKVRVRCKALACAGEPVPADLPAHVPAAAREPLALTRLGLLPLDFSRHGDREPGQEG